MLSGNPALFAATRQSARKGETAATATLRKGVGKTCWTLSHNVYSVRGHLLFSRTHGRWIVKLRRFLRVGIITFIISVGLTFLSRGFLAWLDVYSSFLLLLVIILIGIVFDVLGVASTASREDPFHAMAVHRVPGAREASWLVRNADQVASFSQDIVGDIAGTLSGAVGATIVFRLIVAFPGINEAIATTLMVALVAALTVGAKAYGKVVAFRRRTDIVLWTGRVLHTLERTVGIRIANRTIRRRRPSKRKKQGHGNERGG